MNEDNKGFGLATIIRWLTWLWIAALAVSLPITYYRYLADENSKSSVVGGLALQVWEATTLGPEAVVGFSVVIVVIITVFSGRKAKKPPVQEQDEPELDFGDEESEAALPRSTMQRPPQESNHPPIDKPPPTSEKNDLGWGGTLILVAAALILLVVIVLPSGNTTPTTQQTTANDAVRDLYTIILIAIVTTVISVAIIFVAGWVYQWPVSIKVEYTVNLGKTVRNPATVKVTVLVKRIFTAEGILNYLRLSGARKNLVGEKLVVSVERGEIRGLEWITSRIMAAINSVSNVFEMEIYRSSALTVEEVLLGLLKEDKSLTRYGLEPESVSWGDIGESPEIQSAQAEMTAAKLQSEARAALATGNISGVREFLKGLEGSPELSPEQMYELVRIITQGDVNKDIARAFGAGVAEAILALLSSSRSGGSR